MRLNWYWGFRDHEKETRFAAGHPDATLIKEMAPLEREVFRAVLWYLLKETDKIIKESG